MKQVSKILLGAGLAILGLTACTKELPYKEKFKDEVRDKSAVDTKSEYLFSASVGQISRTSSDAIPFSSGDNKRIKLEWTKTSLRVMEVERDARYRGNTTNNKLVLDIPIEHVEYECAKDRFGECTNEDAERDIEWKSKAQFKFKEEAPKSASYELLPMLSKRISKEVAKANEKRGSSLIGGDDMYDGLCYKEVTSRVADVKLEADAINIDIERTFKVHPWCQSNIERVADATVTGIFHYSMVKTSAVLSPGFKPVEYLTADSNAFGFFATEKTPRDTSHNTTESGKQVLMNHWNPSRTEIVYYLSDEFAKPENAKVRAMTFKTVDSLNAGLKIAGVKFRIDLKDADGKHPGDIRNSMIVLVEDPVESSVIGYGPQVEDPVTGEIISARTVMFLGTIKQIVKSTYESVLREKRRQASGADKQALQKTDATTVGPRTATQFKYSPDLTAQVQRAMYKTKSFAEAVELEKKAQEKAAAPAAPPAPNAPADQKKAGQVMNVSAALKELKNVRNYKARTNSVYDKTVEGHLKYLHEVKNCAYGIADEASEGSISPELVRQFAADAKPWDKLSEAEKQDVIDKILPTIWIPTLLHELGHNLGLRHNFQGSEDKANHYTEAELKALGADHKMPFSSVMEYGDDLKALTVLGKYDIAALRFGYLRQVELADGKTMQIPESLSAFKRAGTEIKLKEYGYCTDEHTGINAGCRRFDLGTNYSEIVDNMIQSYHDNYEARNYRKDRADFSLFSDIEASRNSYNRFLSLRLMQEVYVRLQDLEQYPEDHKIWKDNPELLVLFKDLKVASHKAARFLMDVVTTPDRTCVIAMTANPNEIVELIPISVLAKGEDTCKNVQLNDKYMVIGQYGKHFNSFKSSESDNSYADQIDVRGSWIDKLMAVRILFDRSLGISTLDNDTQNFTDRAELAEDLQKMVVSQLFNRVTSVQTVEFFTDNSRVEFEVPVDMTESHKITRPIHPVIADIIGIPDYAVDFNQVMAYEVAQRMISDNHILDGKEFSDALRIQRVKGSTPVAGENNRSLTIGNDVLVATPQNFVGHQAISELITIGALAKIAPPELDGIVAARTANPPAQKPAGLSPELEAAWNADVSLIQAFQRQEVTPQFYYNLINTLPN